MIECPGGARARASCSGWPTTDLAWVDVRPDVMARYNDELQHAIAGVDVWQAGCNGYYRTPSGRVVTQWPFSMAEFQRRTAVIDPDAFVTGAR